MKKSAKDFIPHSTPQTEKAAAAAESIDRPLDVAPAQSWAQRLGQQVVDAFIRERTEAASDVASD